MQRENLIFFCISLNLVNFLTLRNENLFSFPSLNRNFALPFSLGEDRLHFGNKRKNRLFSLYFAQFALPLQEIWHKTMHKGGTRDVDNIVGGYQFKYGLPLILLAQIALIYLIIQK